MKRQTKIMVSGALVFVAILIVAGAGMSWKPSGDSTTTIEKSNVPNLSESNNSTPQLTTLPRVNQSDNGDLVTNVENQTSLPQTGLSQLPSSQSYANASVSPEPTALPQASNSSAQPNQSDSGTSSSPPQSSAPSSSAVPTNSNDKDVKSKPSKANDNGNNDND